MHNERTIFQINAKLAVLADIQQKYDMNNESLLGAIIYNCGGIVIDNWIRIYGAGELDFASRNQLFPYEDIVVGEDIIGGLFVMLEGGNVGYFAPDTLEIEDMEISFGLRQSIWRAGEENRYR